jgi:hypothetical protein
VLVRHVIALASIDEDSIFAPSATQVQYAEMKYTIFLTILISMSVNAKPISLQCTPFKITTIQTNEVKPVFDMQCDDYREKNPTSMGCLDFVIDFDSEGSSGSYELNGYLAQS